ncbi:MAG: hypothetical protein WAL84_04015 [Candidatus Dormiibacterota bacterium]
MIRRLLRFTLALPLVAVGLGAASSAAGVGPAASLCVQAAGAHRAGVVVEHGDGRVIRRCVGFNTTTATALAVLQGSGLEVGTSSYGGGLGAAICQIDYEPSTYPPGCFTSTGAYWVLFVSRAGGAWTVSDLGASNVAVGNGDDIGFRYNSQSGADPPPPAPAGTCPVVTPPPARTPTPAARATLPPRATFSQSATPTAHPATAPPTPTSAAGVLGVATPGATPVSVGSLRSASAQPGVNVGVLLAVVGAGGLVGLLGSRVLRRRRE